MSAKTVAEVLNAAADLITPKGAWIQSQYAADLDGLKCEPTSDRAACFCLVGAVSRISGIDPGNVEAGPLAAAIKPYAEAAYKYGLAHWNDSEYRTQAQVVAALRAAALASVFA